MKFSFAHIPLLFFAVLICFTGNCKKPTPAPKPKDPVTIYNYLGDVKAYCVFKPGTYWVYQNDLTGDIDSHWVASCDVWQETQHGSASWSKHITLVQELFDMVIKSNFTDGLGNKSYWEHFTDGTNVDDYPSPDIVYIIRSRKVWSSGSTYNFIFRKPFQTATNYTPYQLNFYPKYTVNGVEYDSVRVFRVENDGVFQDSKTPTGQSGKSDYYFAKGYGIIKIYNEEFRLKDGVPWNQNWFLIRCRIIQ